MSISDPKPLFLCTRQRPTHSSDKLEYIGPVDFSTLVSILRSIDWRQEANQAEWAKKASPTIAVTNQNDQCTFWVSAMIAGSIINGEREPNDQLGAKGYEAWLSAGLENAPDMPEVVTIDSHLVDDSPMFTTASLDTVEECFEWFFDEDYQSLYTLFHWV